MSNYNWPDPTPEMLKNPAFEAIWQCIKLWDVNVPGAYHGYCGATGNHVRAILDALTAAGLVIQAAPSEVQTLPAQVVNEAFVRNKREALAARDKVLGQIMDAARLNQLLVDLENDYANYSEVELKLVDPRTVVHLRRNQRQSLSEVMDAPAAIAVIVTRKNKTETPVYYPLKMRPTPEQLAAVKAHFEEKLALKSVSVRLLAQD